MSNIKDGHFEKSLLNLVHLEFRIPRYVLHSAMPKRIQAVLRTNGGVTMCKMACWIFDGNEVIFKIKCFVVTVLYMCFNKTTTKKTMVASYNTL